MPAEWEHHRATWIAWPFLDFDWPNKIEAVSLVYVEIVRWLSKSEVVEIVCTNDEIKSHAKFSLTRAGITFENVRLHTFDINRTWFRDNLPTCVYNETSSIHKNKEWIKWIFNAWANYDDFDADQKLHELVHKVSNINIISPVYTFKGNTKEVVLEGGAFDVDGQGTLLTTEQCLLSDIQQRNPGFTKIDYENVFKENLGITKTIWLDSSCEGDDTNGHIDDVARFVSPGKVVLSFESDPQDSNHESSLKNLKILETSKDSKGRDLEIIKLPMPSAIYCDEIRLPASYANFYIGNKYILVPTFNDPNDRVALSLIAKCFPNRITVGIHAVDLVLGYGTLHCLTQQEIL